MYKITALSSALLVLGLQAPSVIAHDSCKNPIVRKEWRILSTSEKSDYIDAVKCLQALPSQQQNLYPGSQTRFDDFQGLHIDQTDFIHFVGHFQAWHRVFVAKYESDLRGLCGYTGAQPYWDWTLDTFWPAAFPASPIFDPTTGFGGNGPFIDSSNDPDVFLHIPGKTGGGCITDGPFANMSVNMGPGPSTAYNPRCLTRDFAPEFAASTLNLTQVLYTLAAPDFYEFDRRVQGGISVEAMTYHGGGHLGIGGDLGEVGNVYSSPGDPLFYMHHANLDRLWATWQKFDWHNRKTDVGGPDVQFAYPYDFFGANPAYQNVTLDYVMEFGELFGTAEGGQIRLGDVMDTEGGALCYKYYCGRGRGDW